VLYHAAGLIGECAEYILSRTTERFNARDGALESQTTVVHWRPMMRNLCPSVLYWLGLCLAIIGMSNAKALGSELDISKCDHALVIATYKETRNLSVDFALAHNVDRGTYETLA
jgi:hypothetical protein